MSCYSIDSVAADGQYQEFEVELITEIDSLFDEYAKQNHLCAVASAKDLYRDQMEHICGSGRQHVEPHQLAEEHNQWCVYRHSISFSIWAVRSLRQN